MALFLVIPELQKRGIQTITMTANYGWRGPKQNRPKKTSATAEGVSTADDVVIKWDSCAIFMLNPLDGPLKKCFTSSDLENPAKFPYFDNGQGYIIESCKGKKQAAKLSMDAIHVRGDYREGGAVGVRQKQIKKEYWDPPHTLFPGGGHMPLLVYVGQTSFRSESALTHREDNMIHRGWGPRDPMRVAHMMAIGQRRQQPVQSKGKGTAGKP